MSKKISYSALLDKFNELNLTSDLDEETYNNINSKYKTNFQCNIHNTKWNSAIHLVITKKKMCTECRKLLPKKSINEILLEKNVVIIKKLPQSKATFKCLVNEDHVWDERVQQVQNRKNACFMCQGKTVQNTRCAKINKEDIIKNIEKYGYSVININTIDTTNDIGEFKCKKNHIWETTTHNVYSGKSGCPKCSTASCESISMFIAEQLLDTRFIKTRTILPSKLELDGYNDDLKLAIEYNGSQHYIEQKNHFHKIAGSFDAQLQRDKQKEDECKELGITLIVVPYTYNTFTKIQEYLINKFTKLGIQIQNDLDWIELQKKFYDTYEIKLEALKEIQEYAISREGECVSTNYINTRTPLSFKCKVETHPIFEQRPYDLLERKRWCKLCAHNAPLTDENIQPVLDKGNMEFVKPYNNRNKTQVLRCKTVFQHVVHISWDNFKSRTYCNKCKTLMNYIPIHQYDMDGKWIATYSELEELRSTYPEMNMDTIKNVMKKKKKCKSSYSYKWSILSPVNGVLNESKSFTDIELAIMEKTGITFD